MPAGIDTSVKLPVPVGTVWDWEPFSALTTVTAALGTTAVAGSVTVPVMVPRSLWPSKSAAGSRHMVMAHRARIIFALQKQDSDSRSQSEGIYITAGRQREA